MQVRLLISGLVKVGVEEEFEVGRPYDCELVGVEMGGGSC